MSQWTHVNAMIRIDGIKDMSIPPDLGCIVDFDNNVGMWGACDIPCGSEGSLHHSIDTVGEGLVLWNVYVWGDLRDYDNREEIMEYLNRIIKGQLVRSGVAEINVEYQETIVLHVVSPIDEDTNYKWEIVSRKKSDE